MIRAWYPSALLLAAGIVQLVTLPLWARALAFLPALVGTVVQQQRSEIAESRVKELEAENDVPLWLREQREQETIVSALIVAQHPQAQLTARPVRRRSLLERVRPRRNAARA